MLDVLVRVLNALLMIAMPLVLGVYLTRKLGVAWRLFGIGAVTFIASMLGMLFGKNIPAKRSHQSIILGGIILTAMGIKFIVEHLWL